MTGRPDPARALSPVEAESLRQLKARLSRPAASEAIRAVLARTFLETVARVGVTAEPPSPGAPAPALAALLAQADGADMGSLRRLCGQIAVWRAQDPAAWAAALAAKLPQSIIARRLALAGRDPAKLQAAAAAGG